jgi:hypothetical protein
MSQSEQIINSMMHLCIRNLDTGDVDYLIPDAEDIIQDETICTTNCTGIDPEILELGTGLLDFMNDEIVEIVDKANNQKLQRQETGTSVCSSASTPRQFTQHDQEKVHTGTRKQHPFAFAERPNLIGGV